MEIVYYDAEDDFRMVEEEVYFILDELRNFHPNNIVAEDGGYYPDPVKFYNTFLEHAQIYLEEEKIFQSPSGQNRYRVHSIENQKVFIERIDSKSPKPSSFTYETVRKAVRRLSNSRHLKPGEFMPVLAQECAVVEIHPDMFSFMGEIWWKSKEVVE